jgi:hypothetical protein
LATYATRVKADVLALSVVTADNVAAALTEFARIAEILPVQIELWAGGLALGGDRAQQLPGRVRLLRDLGAFEREITLLAARAGR